MSQWVVTTFPAWAVLLGLVICSAGGAIAAHTAIRRRWPALHREEHNDATRFAFGVVGFVFAFFIGFVVSAMWGQVNESDVRARAEGAAAVQLARDRVFFDPADSDRIQQKLLAYARSAVAEWPVMAGGKSSAPADEALTELYRGYTAVNASTDVQKALLNTSLANLDKASQLRSERIMQARTDTGPPWSLWVVILVTSGLMLGCAVVYGVARPAIGRPMVATIGVLVAVNLFLVLELSHPYAGELSTSTEPLLEVVRLLEGAGQ